MEMSVSLPPPALDEWKTLVDCDQGFAFSKLVQPHVGCQTFWTTSWPQMCGYSAQKMAGSCLYVLLSLAPPDAAAPLLPADFLEQFHRGMCRDDQTAIGWEDPVRRRIAHRLAESPQKMSPRLWEDLATKGGWWSGHGLPWLDKALQKTRWYTDSRRAWLSERSGCQALARALGDRLDFWPIKAGMLEEHWRDIPLGLRDSFVLDLSQRICSTDNAGDDHTKRACVVYRRLSSLGANLDIEPWRNWWPKVFCGWNSPRQSWTSLDSIFVAAAVDSSHPPPGVKWNEDLAHGWGRTLGNMLVKSPEDLAMGIQSQHEIASSSLMRLEAVLEEWGVHSAESRAALDQGLSAANPLWEQVMLTPTVNQDSPAYHQMFARWRAARLNAGMSDARCALSSRPRL